MTTLTSRIETATTTIENAATDIAASAETLRAFTPQGNWSSGTTYSIRDLVIDASNDFGNGTGIIYVLTCTSLTSTNPSSELSAGNWAIYQAPNSSGELTYGYLSKHRLDSLQKTSTDGGIVSFTIGENDILVSIVVDIVVELSVSTRMVVVYDYALVDFSSGGTNTTQRVIYNSTPSVLDPSDVTLSTLSGEITVIVNPTDNTKDYNVRVAVSGQFDSLT